MAESIVDPEAILHDLALLPTTSFHEDQVLRYIQRFLRQRQLPFDVDPYGNIVAHYTQGRASQSLALVAHTDHPGFEVVAAEGREQRALLLGGVSNDFFTAGTPVRIYTSSDSVPGQITGYQVAPDRGQTSLSIQASAQVAVGDWGVWELADYRRDGDLLHLRAADDLAGCAVVLALLCSLKAAQVEADVYGIFTRAEEIGLVGAMLVAQQRLIPTATPVISIEASRTLPGAELAAGPVIRVGDARRTFFPEAEAFLLAGRDALLQADPTAKVQRQLLSGGTCEATAFSFFGYRTTGLALPLGNYHNMGPSNTLAPEYIHKDDLAGAVALLVATVQAAQHPLTDTLRARYENIAKERQERLAETARSLSP